MFKVEVSLAFGTGANQGPHHMMTGKGQATSHNREAAYKIAELRACLGVPEVRKLVITSGARVTDLETGQVTVIGDFF